MRQVVLDTETTGIDPRQHRIIEIGCVELVDRKLTGNHYHVYVNPDRVVEEEAIQVHGITNEFLEDKPRFHEIAEGFYQFIKGAELVIHNAPFDVGFMDMEFGRLNPNPGKVADYCSVLDTLVMAREKHPGQKNNLDALCKRYFIDNSRRELHGALLDSEILAEVYLAMTGGQTSLLLSDDGEKGKGAGGQGVHRHVEALDLPVQALNPEELAAHEQFIALLDKKSDGALWHQINND